VSIRFQFWILNVWSIQAFPGCGSLRELSFNEQYKATYIVHQLLPRTLGFKIDKLIPWDLSIPQLYHGYTTSSMQGMGFLQKLFNVSFLNFCAMNKFVNYLFWLRFWSNNVTCYAVHNPYLHGNESIATLVKVCETSFLQVFVEWIHHFHYFDAVCRNLQSMMSCWSSAIGTSYVCTMYLIELLIFSSTQSSTINKIWWLNFQNLF
jgi:hypothetical protein